MLKNSNFIINDKNVYHYSMVDDTKHLVSVDVQSHEQLTDIVTKVVESIQLTVELVKKGVSCLSSDNIETKVTLIYKYSLLLLY